MRRRSSWRGVDVFAGKLEVIFGMGSVEHFSKLPQPHQSSFFGLVSVRVQGVRVFFQSPQVSRVFRASRCFHNRRGELRCFEAMSPRIM